MADQETFVSNSAESTLSSSAAIAATTLNVTSTASFPAVPFYATVDPGVDASREVVLATAKTATTLTVTRAQDGTSDVAHASGAVIAVVPVAALWTDVNDRVDAAETSIATKADDSAVVHLAGAETITGAKTFSTDPTLADGSSALSVTEGNAAYEALVSRVGAATGDRPTLQGDGTLAFETPAAVGTFSGCRITNSTNQSIANGTPTATAFDTDQVDVGGWHDTATNNTRITVPAGKNGYIRLDGIVRFAANSTGYRTVYVLMNGTTTIQNANEAGLGADRQSVHVAVPTIAVVAGDYFELVATQGSGGALDVETATGGSGTMFAATYLGS